MLVTLGALLAAITAIVIWQIHRLLVPAWLIAAIAVPWFALGVVLRVKQTTLGAEGKYVDLWSVPHCIGGVLLGLVGVPLGVVVAIAAVWEIVEIAARTREYPANRVIDVALAAAGWAVANAAAQGDFALH